MCILCVELANLYRAATVIDSRYDYCISLNKHFDPEDCNPTGCEHDAISCIICHKQTCKCDDCKNSPVFEKCYNDEPREICSCTEEQLREQEKVEMKKREDERRERIGREKMNAYVEDAVRLARIKAIDNYHALEESKQC